MFAQFELFGQKPCHFKRVWLKKNDFDSVTVYLDFYEYYKDFLILCNRETQAYRMFTTWLLKQGNFKNAYSV